MINFSSIIREAVFLIQLVQLARAAEVDLKKIQTLPWKQIAHYDAVTDRQTDRQTFCTKNSYASTERQLAKPETTLLRLKRPLLGVFSPKVRLRNPRSFLIDETFPNPGNRKWQTLDFSVAFQIIFRW